MQTNIEKHAFKYGFEYSNNRYRINTSSTGPTRDFGAPDSGVFNGYRLTNNFVVCQSSGANIVCPNQATADRATALVSGGALSGSGITGVTVAPVSLATITNPFLILSTVRVRDFVSTLEANPSTLMSKAVTFRMIIRSPGPCNLTWAYAGTSSRPRALTRPISG